MRRGRRELESDRYGREALVEWWWGYFEIDLAARN